MKKISILGILILVLVLIGCASTPNGRLITTDDINGRVEWVRQE